MEEVDTLVEQVGMVLEQACMVAELVGPAVLPVVVVAHAELHLEKSAPLVESDAATEDLVLVLCLT